MSAAYLILLFVHHNVCTSLIVILTLPIDVILTQHHNACAFLFVCKLTILCVTYCKSPLCVSLHPTKWLHNPFYVCLQLSMFAHLCLYIFAPNICIFPQCLQHHIFFCTCITLLCVWTYSLFAPPPPPIQYLHILCQCLQHHHNTMPACPFSLHLQSQSTVDFLSITMLAHVFLFVRKMLVQPLMC